jgi:hypothetical protein
MRWGGASRWEHPLSVAQHSLTVLAIREADGALTPGEALRELLHEATEFMLGWDCITPLKAQLGEPFRALEARLQSAIDTRYRLPGWTPEAYAIHKRADGLAAAPEAFHVVGWSRVEIRKTLRSAEVPLLDDPLSPCGFAPLGALAPARCPEAVHRTVQCTQTHPAIRTADDPLPRPLSLSNSPWSRTSCRILMMIPAFDTDPDGDAAAYDEWAALAGEPARPPPDHPQRDFADNQASFDAIASGLTKIPDQGCFSPRIDPRVGGRWHRQNVDPHRSRRTPDRRRRNPVHRVLAVTFTNKAAGEMAGRIRTALGS